MCVWGGGGGGGVNYPIIIPALCLSVMIMLFLVEPAHTMPVPRRWAIERILIIDMVLIIDDDNNFHSHVSKMHLTQMALFQKNVLSVSI